MSFAYPIGYIILSYLIGSIPFGLLLVRLRTGEDIRKVQSGRTGGTNAYRAAGLGIGIFTALLDGLKAASVVWISNLLFPNVLWIKVLSPVAVILGHNYSIYLTNRDQHGKLKFQGGAGGASCVGGSVGLWWPSIFIIIPAGIVVLFVVGYASLATLSVGLISSIVFFFLAITKDFPWIYVLYGLLAEILLFLALRPNIRRLMNGTERAVGLKAKRIQQNH